MSSHDRVVKRFYPNGQVESETTFSMGDGTSWVIKRWHPNGVLASEIPVKNGLSEGVAKFWSQSGEFVGSYEMREGTGIQKAWHADGTLMADISWLNGEMTGRQRAYFEGGQLIGQTYWLRGERVSKKQYYAASAEDPSLPRYEDSVKSEKSRKKTKTAKPAARREHTKADSFADAMLSTPGTREVLEWLRSGGSGTRTLGELPTQEASIRLAEEVYALGATKVWAVDINRDDPDSEGTGKLLVALPKSPTARSRVLEWCAEWAERKGYQSESDAAQPYVFVMLD